MKKKITLLIVLMSLSSLLSAFTPTKPSGLGTEASPYEIYTAEELIWYQNDIYTNKHAKLMADIDLSPSIIGTENVTKTSLSATFDGQGHSILNFEINKLGSIGYTGLFGKLSTNGYIKNLVVKDVIVKCASGAFVGAVVGQVNAGKIENVTVINAEVDALGHVGGICGTYNGSAPMKHVLVANSTLSTRGNIGGITSLLSVPLENAISTNNSITSSYKVYDNYRVGGVVGVANANITNASATFCTINVDPVRGKQVGGVVGYALSTRSLTNIFSGQNKIVPDDNPVVKHKGSIVGQQNLVVPSTYLYDNINDQLNAVGDGITISNGVEPSIWSRSVYDITHDGVNNNLSAPFIHQTRLYPSLSSEFMDSTLSESTQAYARLAASPVIISNLDNYTDSIRRDVFLGGAKTPYHVIWTSSDPNIMMIDGHIGRALSAGTVTLTATIGDYSISHEVTIILPSTPRWRVEIEDTTLYNIFTDYDYIRGISSISMSDTVGVRTGNEVKAVLSLITTEFPDSLFQLVAVIKDSYGYDKFLPMTEGLNDTVSFIMPDTVVRLTTLIDVESHTTDSIPNAIDYLILRDSSSLVNVPTQTTNIDNHIMYKKVFTASEWYTLCFPFNVSRITVLEDGIEYNINPCAFANDPAGNFYIKYIADGVAHESFQSSWQFETSILKNKAYIIVFPHSYYDGKEITFYGDAQTINDASNVFSPTSDGGSRYYDYHGNNSFNIQDIDTPYLYNPSLNIFEINESRVPIYPFTSYVHSVFSGESAPSFIQMNDLLDPITTQLLDSKFDIFDYYVNQETLYITSSIAQLISIYSITGIKMVDLDIKPNIEVSVQLKSGIYIIQNSSSKSYKVYIL